MTLMLSFDDVCSTDEKLLYVVQWTDAYGKNLPPLFLAPDFMLSPQVNEWYDADEITQLAKRCRHLFGRENIISATEFYGPQEPSAHTILLAHAEWKICEQNLATQFLVLNISCEDEPELLLRQLILLRLAFTVYRGDRACLTWLFNPISPSMRSPIKQLSDDEEFDYLIHRVLLDSVENNYDLEESSHGLNHRQKYHEDPDLPF